MNRCKDAEDECYISWWLPKDMDNMAYIFEYCDKYCKELYNVDIDKLKFLNAFMNSELRYEMETGHPKLLSQAAKDTVEDFIECECNNDASIFKLHSKKNKTYHFKQFYWVGWIYAYIHFKSKLPSAEIIKRIPIKDMLEEYYTGHQMGEEGYYLRVEHVFSS